MSVTNTLAAIFFSVALLAWGVPRLVEGFASPGQAASPAAGVVPAQPSTAATASATPAATTLTATPGADGVVAPQATTASPAPGIGNPSQPSTQPPALSDAEQIALQRQLEADGKAYLRALQAQDAGAITAMLAGRCRRTDVPALIARRRAEIGAVAGVPIDQLTPLNQYVGHFDPVAGEAHTILQLDNAGTRVQLPTADGWLLEGGAWKSVNC